MATMNNLEKLIQMATLEQMYVMLEKLRVNTTNNYNYKDLNTEFNFSNAKTSNDLDTNCNTIFESEIKELRTEIKDINNKLKMNNDTIYKLSIKISELEEELDRIKNTTNSDSNGKFLHQQLKGQQILTSYTGFVNTSSRDTNDDVHIKLEIEEKIQDEAILIDKLISNELQDIKQEFIGLTTSLDIINKTLNTNLVDDNDDDNNVDNDVDDNNVDGDDDNDDDEVEIKDDETKLSTKEVILIEDDQKDNTENLSNNEVEINIKEETVDEETADEETADEETADEETADEETADEEIEEQEIEEQETEEQEIEEQETEEQETEEEESEEEVCTEDESESLENNEKEIKIKEDVKADDEEEEEEEEEEEVFEIEIDDVTYFATDEENSILYEIKDDGDIGKRVGIIRDGEPIFD